MIQKLDLDLAIYKGDCPRCNERHPLFIPLTEEGTVYPPSNAPYANRDYHTWDFLCENCVNELRLDIDMESTHKNL